MTRQENSDSMYGKLTDLSKVMALYGNGYRSINHKIVCFRVNNTNDSTDLTNLIGCYLNICLSVRFTLPFSVKWLCNLYMCQFNAIFIFVSSKNCINLF